MPHSRTTKLPSAAVAPQRGPPEAGTGSPRVTRAHSEPPKAFNQRLLKTKIPLGNVSEQNEHNPVSTSASEPSVPHSQSEQTSSSVSGGGPTSGGSAAPKPAATSGGGPAEPTIRHIPIRIEGREEPINVGAANKKPSDFYPSNVKVERRGQREQPAPPNTLKVNNTKNVQNQEPTSPLSPIPSDQPIPMGYHEVDNVVNPTVVTTKTQIFLDPLTRMRKQLSIHIVLTKDQNRIPSELKYK